MLEVNEVYQGDCLDWMELIDDQSVDMILCDLPYGVTTDGRAKELLGNKWDFIIPFGTLWEHYSRIIKQGCAIVLHCCQPFTSKLVLSNESGFKHNWIWFKNTSVGVHAKLKPLMVCEDILVFSASKVRYFPQMTKGKPRWKGGYSTSKSFTSSYKQVRNNEPKKERKKVWSDEYYPKNILDFSAANLKNKFHPTQKPVELAEYLIKTYTQPGELVLDNCAGSGTTAIACINTNRNYILIEKIPKYVEICEQRITDRLKGV